MKLAPARVDAFLRDPGPCRVVLLYGDDAGMIRERAVTLVRTVAGSLDDPFLVVLEGSGLGTRSRLRTELEAASDGVAIGCYPEEGHALEATIRDTLKQAG